MERYNYYRAVKHDVLDYIHENLSSDDWQNNRDGLEEHLSDVLWTEDSVTGNASGSYRCNAWKAEEALCHNWDRLGEALREFGSEPDLNDPEAMDVTIRCYILSESISLVLDYLENDGWFSRPSVINPFGEVIPANAAAQLMNDDLREAPLRKMAPCREQDLFNAYCSAHQEKFGEVWELASPTPYY